MPEVGMVQPTVGPVPPGAELPAFEPVPPVPSPSPDETTRYKLKLTREEYVQLANEYLKEADDARKTQLADWQSAWELYDAKYDWSDKERWQSQQPWPLLSSLVDFAAELVKQAAITAKEPFGFTPASEADEEAISAAEVAEKLTLYWLQQNGGETLLAGGFKTGFLTGMTIFKVYATEAEPNPLRLTANSYGRSRFRIVVDPVRETDFWIDPKRPPDRPLYVIHRSWADLYELYEQAEAAGYDTKVLDEAGEMGHGAREDTAQDRTRDWDRERKDTSFSPRGRSPHEVHEYYFRVLPDPETGKPLHENVMLSVLDGKWLLRPPQEIPGPDHRCPFVWGSPILVPFSTYNKGIARDADPIVRLHVELVNLMMDAVMGEACWAYWYDPRAVDPEDSRLLEEGLRPAGMYPMQVEPGSRQAPLQSMQLGKLSPRVLEIVLYLERAAEKATHLPEHIRGLSGQGPRETAREYLGKLGQQQSFLTGVVQQYEDGVVAPLALMIHSLVAEYQPFDTADMERLLGPPAYTKISTLGSYERRRDWLKPEMRLLARGISGILSRQQDLQSANQLLQIGASMPIATLALKMGFLIRKVVEAHGWDPDDVLKSPEELKELERIMPLLIAQAVAQKQGGGAAPPGGPGPQPGFGPPQMPGMGP